ncbi:energy transducer TonB [Tanticharoenia sakaeratensis]|uniref:energy transducer TonB n=2 Tax=Tanticharoenia sakaeratensis TaxID=444053 RepID=UPI002156DB70|nr:energy transducer TonB [Tanticharoenia sakaeratensis]GBQ19554.1 TonB periplasmic protein [Tanticharoenia sakaeratensis NBRC 103193]
MVRPRRSERVRFRRALVASWVAHGLVVAWIAISLPESKPPEPPEPPAVEMDFTQSGPPSMPHKADHAAPKPVPAPAPVRHEAPPAPTPPKAAPTEEPPPPPPPPQPVPPPAPSPPTPLPPVKLPPKMVDQSEAPLRAAPPPPAPPAPAKMVAPPTPEATKATELPETPQFSHLTQPNKPKKAAPDSHSLLATLDAFRADQKQTHAPTARANPDQGGAPDGGGVPNGDITRALNVADQKAIGASVRRCYAEDTAARDYATFNAHLVVTVDASGEARIVKFAPETAAKMASDPSYRALAERARDAVLSPECAKLPIPPKLLGQTHELRFVFRP